MKCQPKTIAKIVEMCALASVQPLRDAFLRTFWHDDVEQRVFSTFISLQLFVSHFFCSFFFFFIYRACGFSNGALCKWRIGYAYASMWCRLKMFAQAILFFLCDFVTTGISLHMDFTYTTYLFACFFGFSALSCFGFFLSIFYSYVSLACAAHLDVIGYI